jgi:hypothetical protein
MYHKQSFLSLSPLQLTRWKQRRETLDHPASVAKITGQLCYYEFMRRELYGARRTDEPLVLNWSRGDLV